MEFDALDGKDIRNRMRPMTRLILRLFRRRLNADLLSPVILRAYERGLINSHQMHALAHHFDPTQKGTIGLV